MSKVTTGIVPGILGLAVPFALYFLSASAQEPKGDEKKPKDDPSAILGVWDSTDRHVGSPASSSRSTVSASARRWYTSRGPATASPVTS